MSRMDNEWSKFFTDIDGDVRIRTHADDWFQRVAEGGVSGYSSVEKHGENPDVTTSTEPEDIWDGGGLYTFSTTGDIDRISSDDDGDTEEILIDGLDANWERSLQTVTLTGQTQASLDPPLVRVCEMRNVGSSDLAGNVYCYVNGGVTDGVPDDSGDIRAIIRVGNNKTLMGMFRRGLRA